jgi:glycosyltransferase involved in cell wall biosynthesis
MAGSDRLRIALLLESDGPGGAEVVVYQLGEELARRGHYVLFVGPGAGTGWLGDKFRASGLPTAAFVKRRPLDPRWVSDLASVFRAHQISVVHAHEFAMAVYGTAAARRLSLPVVNTFHGAQSMTQALRRRIALRWAIPRSSASCAVSAATKAQLDRDLGLAGGEIGVVHNGIPVRQGDPAAVRRELGIGADELMLLAIGNLEHRKGHLVLLRALQRLQANGLSVPWRMVIAGGRGGPTLPLLEAFATEHGFLDRLHILTYRNDIANLQAAADIFVMPSLWEGLPLAMLEAMLAGNAVIASETSGIPEAVTTGVEGLLVPPGDDAALAVALERLMTDQPLRASLGEAALRRGLADFTIDAMADRYEGLYRRAP